MTNQDTTEWMELIRVRSEMPLDDEGIVHELALRALEPPEQGLKSFRLFDAAQGRDLMVMLVWSCCLPEGGSQLGRLTTAGLSGYGLVSHSIWKSRMPGAE